MNTSQLSPNHHQSLITVVNHELRTPLTTILLSAELLSRYNNTWSEEKKLEYIQRVQKAASQLTQLINSDEFANKLKDYAEQVQDSV
ncbi:his Kinase A domain protein [Lyngbya aestuarii BL J]|uniref:histidine kinase n=1 Tax=Lyngbya aestuarii BL J TaxID=1348334 RepID=U7QHA6_9CYAN|nr:histidine kinase dimerization/phospho-acceptor domain-containing protein [Lyngbya aestuarii]ERT06662.1 his Kinase A domain protein [Lyngbya aestuarii BL J]